MASSQGSAFHGLKFVQQEVDRAVDGDILVFRVPTTFIFQRAFGQSPLADHQSVGNTHQFQIGKFDARALVTIIQQDINPFAWSSR